MVPETNGPTRQAGKVLVFLALDDGTGFGVIICYTKDFRSLADVTRAAQALRRRFGTGMDLFYKTDVYTLAEKKSPTSAYILKRGSAVPEVKPKVLAESVRLAGGAAGGDEGGEGGGGGGGGECSFVGAGNRLGGEGAAKGRASGHAAGTAASAAEARAAATAVTSATAAAAVSAATAAPVAAAAAAPAAVGAGTADEPISFDD